MPRRERVGVLIVVVYLPPAGKCDSFQPGVCGRVAGQAVTPRVGDVGVRVGGGAVQRGLIAAQPQLNLYGVPRFLKITTARAAFARPGPVVMRFPVFNATTRLSDSLAPSSAAPIPLAAVYHRHGRLFFAAFGHARESAVGVGALLAGFSLSRNDGGGRRASRVSGTSCFIRAKGRHPAGCTTASPFSCGGHAAAFGRQDTLGIRDESFRG